MILDFVRVVSIDLGYMAILILPDEKVEVMPVELSLCLDELKGCPVYWRCDEAGVLVSVTLVTCATNLTRGRKSV